MLNQIRFLFITALQLSFSHQCELHNLDNGGHLNTLPLPGPFPCSMYVPRVTIPSGPCATPAGHVSPINPGSVGAVSPVNLRPVGLKCANFGPLLGTPGPASCNVGPITLGLGPHNLGLLPTARAALDRSCALPFASISPINLAELVASGAGLQSPVGTALQFTQPCVRHALVPVPVQVFEECITNVPVIRRIVRHRTETITRHVPVRENIVSPQFEKIVRHVPVAQKSIRNIIETRIRHVPVIKSRSRTVVEPYTLHVPITDRCIRPVEDSITRNVPHIETRIRPVMTHRVRLVPVVQRRCRPIVETSIQNVPVRRKIVRLVLERRVRPVVGPCQTCCPYSDRPGCFPEHDLRPQSHYPVNNIENHEYQEEFQSQSSHEGQADSATIQNYHTLLANSHNEGQIFSNGDNVQRSEDATSNSNCGCRCVIRTC